MEGRLFHAQIDVTYFPGPLSDGERDALVTALRRDLADFCVTVREDLHTVVVVSAELRADHPVDAITRVSRCLDRALLATGLLEKCDSTGRVLHVRPVHPVRRR